MLRFGVSTVCVHALLMESNKHLVPALKTMIGPDKGR